jgi:GTPase SAR1 family protein
MNRLLIKKHINKKIKSFKFKLLDTTGQEQFWSIFRVDNISVYRIIIYDINDRNLFKNVKIGLKIEV